MREKIKEEIETNDPESFIPKFEDLMIEPKIRLFEDDGIYTTEETPLGASTGAFNLMREMAVEYGTNPSLTEDLNRSQLNTIGYQFSEIYSDTLKFHIMELVYNNVVLVLQNNFPLVDTGFLDASNIREYIYNVIYNANYDKKVFFEISNLHYHLFKATDNSRYVIDPELYGKNKYYDIITKESITRELCAFGDLYVRTIYTNIMYAVDYACNAFFYNFGCKFNPKAIESIVDTFINKVFTVTVTDKENKPISKSPFTITNKFVHCNMMVKGLIANDIAALFARDLNKEIFSIFMMDERVIPSDIFTSLSKIIEIEKIKEEPKTDKKPQIVRVHQCPDDEEYAVF